MLKSNVLILPGLGNSGDGHWQTHWEKQFNFTRVNQKNWDTPSCSDWIEVIDKAVSTIDSDQVILVGHSLACAAIVNWAIKFDRKIKGALLVAPSDTEGPNYPQGTNGFTPMPLHKLNFPSFTIASSNDMYVTLDRAHVFAKAWGSILINIGAAGHINVAAGFGEWPTGLEYLLQLDRSR
jgi:predicted alpha/beta hydrolase family esterase